MRQEPLERLIQSAERGEAGSHDRLFTVLYDELQRLAERELRRSALLTLKSDYPVVRDLPEPGSAKRWRSSGRMRRASLPSRAGFRATRAHGRFNLTS